jgi:hypothetical protein
LFAEHFAVHLVANLAGKVENVPAAVVDGIRDVWLRHGAMDAGLDKGVNQLPPVSQAVDMKVMAMEFVAS